MEPLSYSARQPTEHQRWDEQLVFTGACANQFYISDSFSPPAQDFSFPQNASLRFAPQSNLNSSSCADVSDHFFIFLKLVFFFCPLL